ncbi:hypothetical protein ACS3SW_03490 [Roseobacteraceae bacterium S113]
MSVTDQDLRLYLSGEADEETEARIEGALARDPLLEARLAALDPFAPSVRDAFDALAPTKPLELPDMASAGTAVPSNRLSQITLAAASFVAGAVMLGGAMTWLSADAQVRGWHEEVAAYQALYVADTVAPLSADPATLQDQFARASTALGHDLDLDTFAGLSGFELKRAQILGFQGRPLIQIVYADDDGTPVALCLMKSDKDTAPHSTELKGLAAVHWAQNGLGAILIGGTDTQALQAAAQSVRTTL